MIGDALQSDLERYAEHMLRRNTLWVGAARGQLTPDIVSRYLFNIRHLIRHTPLHLERARQRALRLGDEALADHFAEKQSEEQGHDRWADEDLRRLADELGSVPDGDHAPALLGLLRFIESTIDHDPSRYLAYILFAEGLIAKMGPEWLALVEERCGIPVTMFTVISKHAELDKEHTSEGLEAIDRLVRDPASLTSMRDVLRRTCAYFDEFSAQVTTTEGPECRTSSAA